MDDAWEDVTAGLDWGMKATAEMAMFLTDKRVSLTDGAMVTASSNANDLASYRTLVQHALDGIASGQRYRNEEQRAYAERIAKMLEVFDAGLATRET